MDSLINLTAFLLILSLITEKISDFIKLHFKDLAMEKTDPVAENERQRTIQRVTILIGIGVSLTANANFFSFFKEIISLSWYQFAPVNHILNVIASLIGCILTGFFLSTGSVFFHDLLSMLFEVKNLKKKLNTQAAEEFKNIKEVDQFIQRDEFEFLQKVTEDFQKKLMKIENVGSVTLPYCEDKPSINVYVNSQFNTDTLIPKKFPYADLNGKLKQIDVVIIKDFEPVLHATILNPGDRIMNQVPYPKNAGSLGGRVFHNATNDALFLTCYHVVKSPNQLWNNFNPKCAPNVVDNNVNIASCGRIVFALRDMYLDVAVVQPAPDVVISDLVNGIGIPIHTRQLNGNDRFYHTRVKMFGMMSGLKEGIIYDFGKSVELPYQADPVTPSHKHTLYNVIVIQGKNGQFFSQGGDSGSFIIDDHNYLIGILVGGYGNLSFAMPIETILTETNTKII